MSKGTARRSIWETPQPAPTEQAIQEWNAPNPAPADAPAAPPAISVVEQLRVAEKQPRDRQWERENRPVLYRGVPASLHADLKQIAAELQVRAGDVARAFLEYALLCHQRGDLPIEPVFSNQRLTLFPTGQSWGKEKPGWYEKAFPTKPAAAPVRKGKAAKNSPPKAWQQQVAYRGIPEEVQAAIHNIHANNHVPLGEVVTLLLGHAMQAYQDGRLVLRPQPRQAPGLNFSTRE